MEIHFNSLLNTLQKLESFTLISTAEDFKWIHFYLPLEESLNILVSQINELKDHYEINLLSLINTQDSEDQSFQLTLEDANQETLIKVLDKKLASIIELGGDSRKSLNKEAGLPDLSLVTIHQMAKELKNRHNLTFALVWIEETDKNNMAIEGNGNPTQIIGLLTRGTHIAIEWADSGIRFKKPKDDL